MQGFDRYENFPLYLDTLPNFFLAANMDYFKPKGLILDAAMGAGPNTRFLIHYGFKVLGVDLAKKGLDRAKLYSPTSMIFQADLENHLFPKDIFDGIVIINYFDHTVITKLKKSVKPDGVFLIETLLFQQEYVNNSSLRSHFPTLAELKRIFSNWDLFKCDEGWQPANYGGIKRVVRVIAKRPSNKRKFK